MLTHVVREWLARVKDERDIDAALIAYLGAAGYRNVHFNHGPSEIGKDFLAQSDDGAERTQWVIQSKSGDVRTGDWREPIRGQMWEAVRLGVAHPAFDATLPRQGVLALTGSLVGGGKEQIEKFNAELEREGRRPIVVWHREELVQRFSEVDPATVYPLDKAGYLGYGRFFTVYGDALDGRMTAPQMERHSRFWLADAYAPTRLLLPAVEASVIASASEAAGDLYGAFQTRLALVRTALDAAFVADGDARSFGDEAVQRAMAGAVAAAERFCDDVWRRRDAEPKRKLVNLVGGTGMVGYPVLCLRLAEALAFVYLAAADDNAKSTNLARLRKIIVTEPGAGHPVGDRYAVSIVAAVRALLAAGEREVALAYLRATSYWVMNLYASRLGLASLFDDERGEVDRLFGADIPEIRVPQRSSSFMSTALLDLAAFAPDDALYAAIENDVRCHGVHPKYYRPLDTRGQFRLDGADVSRSANVVFRRSLGDVAQYGHGEHLVDEPRKFALIDRVGAAPYLALSLLLRDRYFPTTWSELVPIEAG